MDSLELAIATAIARDSLPERECTKCGELKGPGEFPAHAQTRSGLDSRCRACCREAKARLRAKLKAENTGKDPYANPSPKRCPGCRRDLPRREFQRHAKERDGLYSQCRDCYRERDARKRAQRKARHALVDPYADPSPKRCSDCGRDLPRTEFSRNATQADGLQGVCRSCLSRRTAAWARENPDKRRAHGRKRRALQRSVYRAPYTEADILAGNGGMCRYCESAPATAIDHFIPISWGGDEAPWNLVGACTPCNSSKGDRDPYEWMASRGIDLDAWEARHIAGWFDLPEELWESVRSYRPPAEEV